MELHYGAYFLDPNYEYLVPSVVLFLLCILCFLVRYDTTIHSQKHHSFPAVGVTTLVGGLAFLACHFSDVRHGQTTIILANLALFLILFWIGARVLYPAPKKGPRIIKAPTVDTTESIDSIDSIDPFSLDSSEK